MYGDAATELIRHITRDNGDIIPEYQFELVEKVTKENEELFAENLRASQTANQGDEEGEEVDTEQVNGHDKQKEKPDKSNDDDTAIDEKELMLMQVRHTAKLWNKRCVIAYHYERLLRLKQLRWEYGNNLPKEIVKNLSRHELNWFTKYNENLFSYMNLLNNGNGLDLTLYIHPPKKLYIQVRCLRDYGQFEFSDGQPVMLKKNSIHYLPLSQCEKLIHQGVLEQTSL